MCFCVRATFQQFLRRYLAVNDTKHGQEDVLATGGEEGYPFVRLKTCMGKVVTGGWVGKDVINKVKCQVAYLGVQR